MAITPQAIKDQEFLVKFRGYDPVEVKAYLELIAEEFFELLEQVRHQVDELDVIVEERDMLQAEKIKMQDELNESRGSSEEIKTESAQRDDEVASLQAEIENLKKEVQSFERQCSGRDQELAEAQTVMKRQEEAIAREKERNDKLNDRIDDLEKQNKELRSEELSFKSTLVAAQQFTTELKQKSEREARRIVQKSREEAEQLRQDTFAELAKYPAEIERLKKKRSKVRDELEAVLTLSLENLDIFKDEDENDDGELFEKIELDDSATRANNHVPAKENEEENGDELQDIHVNFDLMDATGESEENAFFLKDETADETADETVDESTEESMDASANDDLTKNHN
ncbi:MAG: DivIVA domain-containing protein [Desulfopila sp.]